jgi:hypothetical protein
VSRKALDELKQQIPLLDYLQAHDWWPVRALSGGRWMGLCPLHMDHKPSFLVDPNKGLFYCYGCGRGGRVIRFAELYHQVSFPQAVTLLRQWCGLAPLLNAVIDFYRIQLHRHNEAVGLSGPARTPLIRGDRAHADRLRGRPQLAKLAHAVGLSALGSCDKPVSSLLLAKTAISDASFFHWKAISMAAASGIRRYRIDLCPDRKAVCICGSKSGDAGR